MKTTPFFPWAGPVSVLGYGTTSFMSAGTTAERLELLECAHDSGITHFDTAAYYGHGESERLLGRFLKGRRDQVTVTTKFGIEPTGVVKSRWVNLLARRVLKTVPPLRKLLARKPGAGTSWGVFEPEKARASLDRSLLALGTDHVDLFLLHEPSLSAANSEPLIEFLEKEKQRGRIRAYGCGGEGEIIEGIAKQGTTTARWLQFEDNVINRRIERIQPCGANCITFAPFNSALKTIFAWLAADVTRTRAWSHQLDLDCGNPEILSSLLQASSHTRNPNGILLFSSRRAARIIQAAKVAGGDCVTREQVEEFLQLTSPLQQWEGRYL